MPFWRSGNRAMVFAMASYSIRRARSCCAASSRFRKSTNFCRVSSLVRSVRYSRPTHSPRLSVFSLTRRADVSDAKRRTESSDFLLIFLNLGCRDFVDPFRFPELLLELVETYTEDRVRCQPVGPRARLSVQSSAGADRETDSLSPVASWASKA